MPGVNEVIDAIRRNSSPLEIMVDLKIPPCRLMRIMQGKNFFKRIAMEDQLAKSIMHYRAATNAGFAMTALAGLMVDKKEETIRKSCTAILRHLVSGKLIPKQDEPTTTANRPQCDKAQTQKVRNEK